MTTPQPTRTTNTMNFTPLAGLILPALWWGYLLIGKPRK